MIYVEKTAKVVDARLFDGTQAEIWAISYWLGFRSNREITYDIDYDLICIKDKDGGLVTKVKEGQYIYFIDGSPETLFVEDKDFFENNFKEINAL